MRQLLDSRARSSLLVGLLCLPWLACADPRDEDTVGPADGGDTGVDETWEDGSLADDASLAGDAETDDGGEDPVEPPCTPGKSDADGDGVTSAAGDCNDCDRNVNPGAYDVPGNKLDEDCSGTADDESDACDSNLALAATDAGDAAKSLGICRKQKGTSWGLIKASWVYPNGTAGSAAEIGCTTGAPPHPLSRGILPSFGAHLVPRHGASMLALSSGVARSGTYELTFQDEPAFGTSPLGAIMCTRSEMPAGFPKSAPSCPTLQVEDDNRAVDSIALELTIKVPSNAVALSFDFDFFATEFPEFVCTAANDTFVALLTSNHPATPEDHNIAFDSAGNVVSVNSSLLRACEAVITDSGKVYPCPLGPRELEGTGMTQVNTRPDGTTFLLGGSTSWLTTKASVVPGETITLRFAVWDAGGPQRDITTLVDNFRWVAREGNKPPAMDPPVTDVILF